MLEVEQTLHGRCVEMWTVCVSWNELNSKTMWPYYIINSNFSLQNLLCRFYSMICTGICTSSVHSVYSIDWYVPEEVLTYLVHVQGFPLEWGIPCSSLESQESACRHHPFPSAEILAKLSCQLLRY